MSKLNRILLFVIIVILMIGWIGKQHYDKKLEQAYNRERTLKISKDSLQEVADNQYRKLVGDTLKQRELNKIIDSLQIKLDAKPKVVIQTVFVPKEQEENPVDVVVTEGDTLSIEDYYPQKENYFVKYSARVNKLTEEGVGKFTLAPFNLNMVISQRKDGIYQLDSQVPEWLVINGIRVQSTPLEPPKADNFGWIVGGGYGTDLTTDENYIRVNGGFRFKKFYVIGGASTNGQVDIGAQLEF